MPDKVILNTETIVTHSGSSLSIYTYYVSGDKYIIAYISDKAETVDGISIKENELIFIINGYDLTDFYLNSNGDLIVDSDIAPDFDVNSDGMLTIYEEE